MACKVKRPLEAQFTDGYQRCRNPPRHHQETFNMKAMGNPKWNICCSQFKGTILDFSICVNFPGLKLLFFVSQQTQKTQMHQTKASEFRMSLVHCCWNFAETDDQELMINTKIIQMGSNWDISVYSSNYYLLQLILKNI